MSKSQGPVPKELELPRPLLWDGNVAITAPSHASFTSRFGNAFPEPRYLESELGRTALYELLPPSGQSKRPVLIVHGANTPALGMLALARELQALDPDTHIALFDIWGHGLTSTPLVAHTPQIFHFQMFQVLCHMQWTQAHLLGFSFGGATVITFALQNPWAVLSATIMAPGGLIRKQDLDQNMQELLDNSRGREGEAADVVLSWLEGGPLVVPEDWQEQAKSGKVSAPAFREWELQEHRGHPRSLLSMFRDGGVLGADDTFRAFAKLPMRNIALVAELDPVCNQKQLVELGFHHVEVVKNEGHDFVRTVPGEVARIIHQFWQQEV